MAGDSDFERLISCKGYMQADKAYCEISRRLDRGNGGKLLSYGHRNKNIYMQSKVARFVNQTGKILINWLGTIG